MEKRSSRHVRGRSSDRRRNRWRNVAAFALAFALRSTEFVIVSALTMIILAGFVASALAVIAGAGNGSRRGTGNGCSAQILHSKHIRDESGLLYDPVIVCARDEKLIGCRCCYRCCWHCCGGACNLLRVPDRQAPLVDECEEFVEWSGCGWSGGG